MSEIIGYNTPLSSRDIQRIHSYLAIKYAIGLDERTENNRILISSSGRELWKNPVGYTGSIAGIGRDDRFELIQKQSQASTNNPNIIIGIGNISEANHLNNGTFAENENFLIWGDNSGSGVNRIWRLEATGDLPTLSIAYPQSLSAGQPNLHLSSSPDFS